MSTINLRKLFQQTLINTGQAHGYLARNDSNYLGRTLTAQGSATVVARSQFDLQDGSGLSVRPLHLIKSLSSTGSGSSHAVNNEMVFWFDSATAAFRGFSVCRSNYLYRPIPGSSAFGTFDWQQVPNWTALAWPDADLAVDWTYHSRRDIWSSRRQTMLPYAGVPIDANTSDAHRIGQVKHVPGWRFGMQALATPIPLEGLIRFRFDATVWVYDRSHQDITDLYVDPVRQQVVRVVTSNDFVVLTAHAPHKFRIESMRLTRL